MTNKQLHAKIVENQLLWQDHYRHGRRLRFLTLASGMCAVFSEEPPANGRDACHRQFEGFLPGARALVVGMDIREYSRRKPEHQMFLTMNLHIAIRKAVQLLQDTLSSPDYEPRIVVQTGDGALVVFTALDQDPFFQDPKLAALLKETENDFSTIKSFDAATTKLKRAEKKVVKFEKERKTMVEREIYAVAERAISFVFIMNALLATDNAREGFVADTSPGIASALEHPVFPLECRFAISFGEVMLLNDVNETLNCVGAGMVTCARILAADHGKHFLIDYELLKLLEKNGGLKSICRGRWGHRLHSALLAESKIKSGHFRYADVFGFYNDGPLMHGLSRGNEAPVLYHIGSHDISTIDM